MTETINIPKEEYDYLKRCEHIIREIEEDETLTEEEIKLIEIAKKGRRLSKEEFLEKFRKL